MNETWTQIIVLFLANVALICWFRSESRSDHRQCLDLILAIKEEVTNFHTRLIVQDLNFKNTLTIEEINEKIEKIEKINQLEKLQTNKYSNWEDNLKVGL